jgi:uncharacterized coiled-coil DUF342 family protein
MSDALARWSHEGRQLLDVLGGWLEEVAAVHGQVDAVQSERDELADDVQRIRAENEELRVQRDELQQTLQTLARQMTHAADAVLSRLRRRDSPADSAPR